MGHSVIIFFVHRDPIEAFFEGVLPRAEHQGRVVSIEAHVRVHSECLKTFRKLLRIYRQANLVRFYIVQNTTNTLPELKPVEYLDRFQYSRGSLE